MKKLIFVFTLILSSFVLADESRISLTTSDGSGLELRQLEAKVVLESFLAFTELKLTFYNPEDRRREGRFQIILPNNAAISRFAMKIGEELQEGEVVEKQLAQRAYEDFLHQRQDPALLETDSGNRFNARIFPIEPKSEKVLILSYSQRLEADQSDYVLPLKGLPKLKQLAIQVFYDTDTFNATTQQIGHFTAKTAKRDVITVNEQDYQPVDDFRMVYQAGAQPNLALQNDKLIAARIIPFPKTQTEFIQQDIETLVVLIDTSASQAPFLTETIAKMETLLLQLKPSTLLIYNFDQELHEVGKTVNIHSQIPALQLLKQTVALGASRLDNAFTGLAALKLEKAHLLLISDMVVTAGDVTAPGLIEQLKKISWLERMDVLIPSYHSDQQLARLLIQEGHTTGIVADLQLDNQQLINKLTRKTLANIPIKITGSTWFYPETLSSVQIDEPVLIFAELEGKTPFSISVEDRTISLTIKAANPILLKREWVRARIDKLLNLEIITEDKDLKSAFHNEITSLSEKERVLSPYTSLLVLETEEDYRRYNIDRRGLADILTIGVNGIEVIKRSGHEVIPVLVIPEQPVELPELTTGSDAKSRRESVSELGESAKKEDKEMSDTLGGPVDGVLSELPLEKTFDSYGDVAKDNAVDEEFLDSDVQSSSESSSSVADRRDVPLSTVASAPPDITTSNEVGYGAGAVEMEGMESDDIAARHNAPRPAVAPAYPDITASNEYEADAMESMEVENDIRPDIIVDVENSRQIPESPSSIEQPKLPSWTGDYAQFHQLLDAGKIKESGDFAQNWHKNNLSDVMSLIALAEWYEKTGENVQAVRAYGSLIDYFPARADIRRWAAERLLAHKSALWLSIDSLEKAVKQRPDHPSGHYLLAVAYWENNQYQQAVETLQAVINQDFPRFAEANRILTELLGLMLTTLKENQQIEKILPQKDLTWNEVTQSELRLVLMWETDANDVDFHIYDNAGNHAFYSAPNLASGGVLYADITTGYGPECFMIPNPAAYPYQLKAHYYSMGPMGYGMGLLHILKYAPKQGLTSEFRPFIVMQNDAYVELGEIKQAVRK